MRVYIIRHAESYSNTQKRMMSSTDLPLTDKGIRQAGAARERISGLIQPKGFTHAFCSPLLRARHTAEIVVGGKIKIAETHLLREMDLGDMEGLTWEETKNLFSHVDWENALSETAFPKGESFGDIKIRCGEFISRYLSALDEGALVLVATHGITSRVLINCLLGRPDSEVNYINWADNTSFTVIDRDIKSGAGKLVLLNERRHLTKHGLGTPDYEIWGLFSKTEYA